MRMPITGHMRSRLADLLLLLRAGCLSPVATAIYSGIGMGSAQYLQANLGRLRFRRPGALVEVVRLA
jgi:hypothetical protein